jgi:hypothetical protein
MRLYIGLVHYPVYNKNREKIASAITNFDLHDLSRLARTYGAKRLFVITPLRNQHILAERISAHWTSGYGAGYNIHRKEALEIISVVSTIEAAIDAVRETEVERPLIITTDASRQSERSINYLRAREILDSERTVLVIFGTAWGLHEDILRMSDFILDPIEGNTDYNHLSVRTAAGIILDRLAGRYE